MSVAHAELGASSTHRWMTCPGSVALSQGLPNPDSSHAREGSAAHALGETCLLNGEEPFEYLGEPHPVAEYADIEVTVDMVDAVTVYTDWVRSIDAHPEESTVEVRVSLEKLGDWAADMFGTGDFCCVVADEADIALHVGDLKFGMGVAVEVPENPQLKYYAVGALLALGDDIDQITKVVTTVIQPRKPHEDGPIRSHEYPVEELMAWANGELKQAVLATDAKDAPLVPSEKGCKFCLAKGTCPALKEKAMADAMLEFGTEGVKPLTAMDKLTPEQIAQILESEKAIKDWLAGVAQLAYASLEQGQDITGGRYKLVAGRNSREWKDEEAAALALAGFGFVKDDYYTLKLATPAQAEKLVGKANKDKLAELIATNVGKPTLAPADDKRKALDRGPEADFVG